MKRVLVIDDDDFFTGILSVQLEANGYACHCCPDFAGASAWIAAEGPPDIILLDYDLGPGHSSGLDVARQLKRFHKRPLIMLTGNDRVETIVSCLDAGADQYMLKPYILQELLARMRACLRLYESHLQGEAQTVTRGGIRLDTHAGILTIGDRHQPVTDMESAALEVLISHLGKQVDRDLLSQLLYERDYDPANRSLDMLMGRVRKKLAAISGDYVIKTVRGKGFRLSKAATSRAGRARPKPDG